MIKIRKASARGHAEHGWLDSFHTFSFADYFDPEQMGFSVLRVINEDRIAGGKGFPPHSHRDMEIISVVIEGALEHKDSMGNITVIKPGEVQLMSAGTGVQHSEMNHLSNETTHFLQIWILPEEKGIKPGYGQKSFESKLKTSPFVLAASKSGDEDSIVLNQDVNLFIGKPISGSNIIHLTGKDRCVWIQVARGSLKVNQVDLSVGDGVAVSEIEKYEMTGDSGSEFLLFDMPSR